MLRDDMSFHAISAESVLEYLETGTDGLTDEEVIKRKAVYGPNILKEGKRKTLFAMFLEQFKDVMVIILLIAAAISGFLKEFADTAIILAVVIINAILGIIQESKAEKALEALKKMSAPYSKVKRNGDVLLIKTEDIVPGDSLP